MAAASLLDDRAREVRMENYLLGFGTGWLRFEDESQTFAMKKACE
jgi:hypothetical protein